jgi:hypothetical protein
MGKRRNIELSFYLTSYSPVKLNPVRVPRALPCSLLFEGYSDFLLVLSVSFLLKVTRDLGTNSFFCLEPPNYL